MIAKFGLALILTLGVIPLLPAAIIGTNSSAQPVTSERVARLPASQRLAWKAYLKRSAQQRRADQEFLRAEMEAHGIHESTRAPSGRSARSLLRSRPTDWYGGEDGRRIADIVVSFQTPAGGWSKNINLTRHPRAPGEHFAPDNTSRFLGNDDNDAPLDGDWSYVGTFDNNATTTELRFLAKVIAALPEEQSEKYRAAFLRGQDYIFNAQYPNGGWPQVWPLQGGYHDAITLNDRGYTHVLELLDDVKAGENEFAFVPQETRTRAAASIKRGIECLVALQITVDGRRTVWCQQHDALTLEPTAARNYEMPSACTSESAEVMRFLMRLPDPPPEIVASVHAAAAWFKKTKLLDVAWRNAGAEGRILVDAPGNGPIWGRFYDIGTDRPIFGDRDKTIHDTVAEISRERRGGYAWFVDSPEEALEQYESWSKKHPADGKPTSLND